MSFTPVEDKLVFPIIFGGGGQKHSAHFFSSDSEEVMSTTIKILKKEVISGNS